MPDALLKCGNVVLDVADLAGPIESATDALARSSRVALGLDPNRPVVGTGHQPGLHHGGLIVKDMVAQALAQAHGGTATHLMLDTTGEAVFNARMPVCRGGRWTAAKAFEATEGSGPLWQRSSALVETRRCFDDINLSLDLSGSALEQANSLMRCQWDRAGVHPQVIRSSSLLATPAGAHLLEAMGHDPGQCAASLAQAIATEGITDLQPPAGGDDPQLPLWVSPTRGGSARRTARASDLKNESIVLEPKAVVTTALMRLWVSDRWVHGTGGERYDRVTARWVRDWLGLELAPASFATAHVRLSDHSWRDAMGHVEVARRGVQQARHDLAPGNPSPQKVAMLKAIEGEARGSAPRRAAFDAMHKALAQGASQRRDAATAVLEAAIEQAQLLQRRDWPLVTLPQERSTALMQAVEAAIER
ncbi:MAG: hypothetical protein MK101_07265 [Phycisphaerales bacterium]|nr:hypothetical protein [Phycisphaerales bacterium]